MLHVSEALQQVLEKSYPVSAGELELAQASGRVLAGTVEAPTDFPLYAQSAMDGYAMRFADRNRETFHIAAEIKAGDSWPDSSLKEGEVYRVFTGALVPPDADTVVMQESIQREGDTIRLLQIPTEQGAHIRPPGSQHQKGEVLLEKGIILDAPQCGLLASAGVASVSVYRKPSVGILCTGNELVQVGHTLKAGQVYDSNSHALLAALKLFPVETVHCEYAGDALPEIEKKLQQLLATSDMVLITGGVSVGDYDFVSKALDNQGVQCGFHNVKQRPGKPLYFGTRERKLIFGLPGNPASVLTCFYYYVWPALRTCCGFQMVRHQSFHFPLQASFHKRNALTQFLRALYEKNSIRILDHQESYKMDSFARSHGLAILPEETGQISAGDLVEFFFFNL